MTTLPVKHFGENKPFSIRFPSFDTDWKCQQGVPKHEGEQVTQFRKEIMLGHSSFQTEKQRSLVKLVLKERKYFIVEDGFLFMS